MVVAKRENKCKWKRDVRMVRVPITKTICQIEFRRKWTVHMIGRVFCSSSLSQCSTSRCVRRNARALTHVHTRASSTTFSPTWWIVVHSQRLLLRCPSVFPCNAANYKNRHQWIPKYHVKIKWFEDYKKIRGGFLFCFFLWFLLINPIWQRKREGKKIDGG